MVWCVWALQHKSRTLEREPLHIMTQSLPFSVAPRPLEAGMVISIETHVKHLQVGSVKLEDTVAVTDSGWEAFGDGAEVGTY
jgi:Xaa-Pro aminopeptidase